jgi:hypothetical protein
VDVTAGLPFEAVLESGVSGYVPGIELAIIDNLGTVVTAASGIGITEQVIDGAPTGVYLVTKTAPIDPGQYTLVWSNDGSFDPDTVSVEGLNVYAAGVTLPPIGVPAAGAYSGPCSLWVDVDQIAACCEMPTGMDEFELIAQLTNAATVASELLFWAEGRRHAGACQRIARPCQTGCSCGYQVLSRGHLVGWDGNCWGDYNCGCTAVSAVKLAGSVREILEVTIDGVVVDPAEYFVDERRWLVRKAARWPACQARDLDPDQPGTFAVTYIYGKNPPASGTRAARQLACELFKSCTGSEDCNLPTGVMRVTRQNVTFERSFLSRDEKGIWRSGLGEVDLYLNTINPHGLVRRPTFWSPSRRARYARG